MKSHAEAPRGQGSLRFLHGGPAGGEVERAESRRDRTRRRQDGKGTLWFLTGGRGRVKNAVAPNRYGIARKGAKRHRITSRSSAAIQPVRRSSALSRDGIARGGAKTAKEHFGFLTGGRAG